MSKANRSETASSKMRPVPPIKVPAIKARSRAVASKPPQITRAAVEPIQPGWATNLVFDVREPKLAVSLRLDADVLRFFRGFGAGYQTRINEVLKAFMQARSGSDTVGRAMVSARANRSSVGNGKRAR